MAAGKERYYKNVSLMGMTPSIKEGYGTMYLLGDGMMYYYDYVVPVNGENRDKFMMDVLTHYMTLDGRMRVSFVFASNIIHSLSQIVSPRFLGMDAEMEPLEDPAGASDEADGAEEGDTDDAFLSEEGDMMTDGEDVFAEDDMTDFDPDGFTEDIAPETDDTSVTPLAGTENVTHEAIGSVESIADTPIPFELWLFSIKKMGQNFAAANEAYERLGDDDKQALQAEYNATFGL